MMKKGMLACFVLAGMMMLTGVMLLMSSCQSCVEIDKVRFHVNDDKFVTEKRMLKGFEKIEISGSPTVYYSQSDTFSVKVVGAERLVDNTITEVNGQTLLVRNKGKVGIVNFTLGNDNDLKVYVTSPDLTSIRLSGSGDFISEYRIDTDEMKVELRGSGDIAINDLICDDCQTELVGSGDIRIDRLEARSHGISLVGSGDIVVNQWRVDKTDVMLKGSGDINVSFVEGCKSADSQVIGSGDICLSGQLEHYNVQKRGSGDINIDNLSVEK